MNRTFWPVLALWVVACGQVELPSGDTMGGGTASGGAASGGPAPGGQAGATNVTTQPGSSGAAPGVSGTAGAGESVGSGGESSGVGGDADPGSGTCGSPTDQHNCGRCGHDCTTLPYVNPDRISCVDGECSYGEGACLPGFAHCSEEEGCREDLTTSSNCGQCGRVCGAPTPRCASPAGQPPTCVAVCPSGTTWCGSQCVDLQSNAAHCGACNARCSSFNGVARCDGGSCVEAGCFPGFGDCSEVRGCETDLGTFENCGRCGDSCGADHATGICEASQCAFECEPGFESCDSKSPPCETPNHTAQDCGACGHTCSGSRPLCSAGACVAVCGGDWPEECSGSCVDLSSDEGNCGVCGSACEAYQACIQGSCSAHYLQTSFLEGGDVSPHSVEMTSEGAVFLSATLSGVLDTAPGPAVNRIESRFTDAVVVKLNPDGSHAWTRVIGGENFDSAGGLARTASGGIVASLNFRGPVDLDPTDGTEVHTTSTSTAALVKLEGDGRFAWARSFPATGSLEAAVTEANAISVDSAGAIYVSGLFREGLQLEPGAPPFATSDVLSSFLLKLTPDGELVWARAFAGCDLHLGLPQIDSDSMWIGGTMTGACRIEPTDAGSELRSPGADQVAVLIRLDARTGGYLSGRTELALNGLYRSLPSAGGAGFFLGWTGQTGTILKVSAGGAIEWRHSRRDVTVNGLAAGPAGSLVAAGSTTRGPGPLPEGPVISRLDVAGEPTWTLPFSSHYTMVSDAAANATHFVVFGLSDPDVDFDPSKEILPSPQGLFVTRYAF